MRPLPLHLAAVLMASVAAELHAQLPSDRCDPVADPIVEVGEGRVYRGTTCGFKNDHPAYRGSCSLKNRPYPGRDVIYRVVLNPGNDVGFSLTSTSGADFALVLVPECDPSRCIISSPDFVGPGTEVIPKVGHPAGIYALHIDSSAADGCGAYELRMTGTNPKPAADLATTLTSDPAAPVAGLDLTYFLAVTNRGPDHAYGVVASDTLPANVQFKPASSSPECHLSGSVVKCLVGKLAPDQGQTRRIVVKVPASATGTLTNSAVALSHTVIDPQAANNGASLSPTVKRISDLSLAFSGPSTQAVAGQLEPLVYDASVTNFGPSEAANVQVRFESLPSGLALVPSDVCPAVPGDQPRCQLGTLAVGQTKMVKARFRLSPSRPGGSMTVPATVASNSLDSKTTNDSRSASNRVVTRADLEVGVVSAPTQVTAGQAAQLLYVLLVFNDGPSDSQAGSLTLSSLPAGVSLAEPSACAMGANRTVTCGLAPLGVHQSSGMSVRFTVSAAQPDLTFDLRPTVAGATLDPGPRPNVVSVPTTIVTRADLVFASLTAQPDPVVAGRDLVYRATIENRGPSVARNVRLTFPQYSPGLTLASTPDCQLTPGLGPIWPLGPIPAGASVNVEARVCVEPSVAQGESLSVLSKLESATTEQNPGDETKDNSVRVRTEANLGITVSDFTDPVAVGNPVYYEVVVENQGPSDASEVVVDSTLLGGLIFPSTLGCPEDPSGGVSCTLGSLAAHHDKVFVIAATPPEYLVSEDQIEATVSLAAELHSTTPAPVSGGLPRTGQESTTASAGADLSLRIEAPPGPLTPGSELLSTLIINNLGPLPATEVTVLDHLPAGLVVEATSGCLEEVGVPICTLSDGVGAGMERSVTVTSVVTHESATVLNNEAQIISSDPPERRPGDERAAAATVVIAAGETDLLIHLVEDQDPVELGRDITYSLTATNRSQVAVESAVAKVTLPNALVSLSSCECIDPEGCDCQATAGGFDCFLGSLAVGSSGGCRIVVPTADIAPGLVTVEAELLAAGVADGFDSNNRASVETTVLGGDAVDLALALRGSPSPVLAGAVLNYSVGVRNRGLVDLEANAVGGARLAVAFTPPVEALPPEEAEVHLCNGQWLCYLELPITVVGQDGNEEATVKRCSFAVGVPLATVEGTRLHAQAELVVVREDEEGCESSPLEDGHSGNNGALSEIEVQASPLLD